LLSPKRRVYHRWRLVLPLYDGKECPDCGVPVCGREARRVHREYHMRRQEWEEWAVSTILQVARYAGMQVEEQAGGEAGDAYGRVDLAAELDDDDEEDDDE
jgi:hypothetical protein